MKVRRIVTTSNNKPLLDSGATFIPIHLCYWLKILRAFLFKVVSGCSGSRYCSNSLTLMCSAQSTSFATLLRGCDHRRCPMARGCNDDIFITSLEEFRNLIVKEFHEKLGHSEKRAAETGQTIVGEFGISMEQGAAPLLRVCYICEPGKPGLVLTADGPMNRHVLSSWDWQAVGRLH
jgi:hypothetical protein